MRTEDFDEQIAAKRREIEELERRKLAARESPLQKLADAIHGIECHWNHTDGCSWHYESWEKPGYAREQYLKKAIHVNKIEPNTDNVIRILQAIKQAN